MPQIKKDYRMLNIKLDREVSDKLATFTADTGLTKTYAVEQALKVYIDQYNKTGKT